jgi:phosphoribosylformylglycinamidine synthase
VVKGLGINADEELVSSFELVGAAPVGTHVNDLLASPQMLEQAQILALPGGFSFGDHLGSGHVLANLVVRKLGDPIRRFVDRGGLVIGICNGFQVLVKAGLIPDTGGAGQPEASLIHNDSGKFEDRWVHVEFPESVCVWTRDLPSMDLPVRHGEGKFVTSEGVGARLAETRQIALRYANPDGVRGPTQYPHNPNGSEDDIAGVCDPTGRILGLMPHPEAYRTVQNHPLWARGEARLPLGIEILRSGVNSTERR